MANDVAVTAGSGVTIATEDVGSGRQVQLVKPVFGTSGSATDVADATPFPTYIPDVFVTGQGSQLTLNNNIVLATAGSTSYDALGMRSVSFEVVPAAGTFTAGALTFEESNDNVNFTAVSMYDLASQTTNPSTSYTIIAATNRFWFGNLAMRYFRVRISTGVTGTTTGLQCFTKFSPVPLTRNELTVTQGTAASLNATITGTLTALTTLSNGQTAHSSASTGSPLRVAGRVQTAVDTTLVAGDASDLFMSTGGAAIVKPYAVPDVDWSYAGATGGIVNTTTAVTVKAAAAAGIRNYITGIQINTDTLGAATELCIRDGAAGTVLWRMKLQTTALPNADITFPSPLRGTAATLLEVVTLTATTTGGVYVNLQGYTAP